jgi:hypothetical protein
LCIGATGVDIGSWWDARFPPVERATRSRVEIDASEAPVRPLGGISVQEFSGADG